MDYKGADHNLLINKTEAEIIANWKYLEPPLVSCCCVTYNHEQFIAQALAGMLFQNTEFPFEILVRDDCSTDNTVKIIEKFAAKFPNIIRPIFETENQFVKGVRPMPIVIRKAGGQYIALCDGDDYWVDKEKLQKQIDFLSKHEEFAVSFGNCHVVDDLGNVLSKNYIDNSRDFTDFEMITGEALINASTAVFRNVIDPCPEVFRSIIGGDISFWHMLGFHGRAKYQGEIKFSAYRLHPGGVWTRRSTFEKAVGIVQTRFALKMNLEKNSRFGNRIDETIVEILVDHIIQTIYQLEISGFTRLSLYIFKTSEINSLAVLHLLLFRVKRKLKTISRFSGFQ